MLLNTNTSFKNDKEGLKVKPEHLMSVFRIRCVTQPLRFFTALYCKTNAKKLSLNEKLFFDLKSIVEAVNMMFQKNNQPLLELDELQSAINSVVSYSKPKVIDYPENPKIVITTEDALKIGNYTRSMTLLVAEKEHLNITSADNETKFDFFS